MKTVFVDVDTQIDFLVPAGALYVPGAERLLPRLAEVNRYAAAHGIPVVSTVDAHAENDPEFSAWPPHCVVGTAGQQKPCGTLLEKRVVVSSTARDFDIDGAQQIIVEKQWIDMFAGGNAAAILERLNADRWVVYGVVTEYCVRNAVIGLAKTGKPVEVLSDAIQALDEAAGRAILEQLKKTRDSILIHQFNESW
ncbi:MAG TPA: isochorismatase family cysteine hydrolase [Bryobacteraceae bacterium]|nr:isochorismatase family cysteine hydrolase [Bryobacteraceae bacterium]